MTMTQQEIQLLIKNLSEQEASMLVEKLAKKYKWKLSLWNRNRVEKIFKEYLKDEDIVCNFTSLPESLWGEIQFMQEWKDLQNGCITDEDMIYALLGFFEIFMEEQ